MYQKVGTDRGCFAIGVIILSDEISVKFFLSRCFSFHVANHLSSAFCLYCRSNIDRNYALSASKHNDKYFG
jgi:hypothetical protein